MARKAAKQKVIGQGRQAMPSTQGAATVPFDEAAHVIVTEGPKWIFTPGAAATQLKPEGLYADGYLKRVVLEVRTLKVGVEGSTPAASEDYPWNIFNQVTLKDNGGKPQCELKGFSLFVANLLGGYTGCSDPRLDPDYNASKIEPHFFLYVPLELNPEGFGAIRNMSQSAPLLIGMEVNPKATIWTKLETAPELEVVAWQESWDLPELMDQSGNPQITEPPFPDTQQLLRALTNIKVAAGEQNTFLTQMGNMIRAHIIIGRKESGERTNAVMPDNLQTQWDKVNQYNMSQALQRKRMREVLADVEALPKGVIAFLYNQGVGRFAGGNSTNQYLPTVNATAYALKGPVKEKGELEIVTIDVTEGASTAAQRLERPGMGSGYHPVTGEALSGTQ